MALVAFISNPKDVFERNAKPEFDEVAVIDIDGGGIRSLNYDPVLKTYVIANEVKDENGQKFSQLWTWSGNPTDEPQKSLCLTCNTSPTLKPSIRLPLTASRK